MVHSLSNQSRAQGAAINVPVTSATVRTSTVTAANVFVTDLAVSNGVEFTATSAPTAYTGVRFTNAAYDGALVEKRVSENARWGLGVRASDGTTHVHAGAAGSVVLGHRVSSTSVSPAITVSRADTGAANVGINTSSPATALHVVGNVHVDGLTRASGALRMYPDHRRHALNTMVFTNNPFSTYGNLYQYSETLGRVERIQVTAAPRNVMNAREDAFSLFDAPFFDAPTYWFIEANFALPGYRLAYNDVLTSGVWVANAQTVAADANLRTLVRTISTPASTMFDAPTTIGGANVTMGFEYPLFVRALYMGERMSHARRMIGQVYVVGSSVSIENVTNATEWNEIDVLEMTTKNNRIKRDPQPIVKALGLTSSYRTVRVIMYAKYDNDVNLLNISRMRVFGIPAVLAP